MLPLCDLADEVVGSYGIAVGRLPGTRGFGMETLTDSTVVVTGGASGIGLALARGFAAEGCRVVIADVEAAALDAALPFLPRESLAVRTDVSRIDDVEALATATLERFGSVDILCNNAGVSTFNLLQHQTLDDWRWVLDVNLWGVVHGVQTFVPIMRRQGRPAHVVNTASAAGLMSGLAYLGPYAVSKVGVVSLSETLRAELAAEGAPIGVSVLCPGFTNTNVMEAERNRPADLGTETRTEASQQFVDFIKGSFTTEEGKEPDDVAAQVIDAVHHDRFWVVSHAGVDAALEPRFAEILDACRGRGEIGAP
jgi:NAD(P)-dependent dehydrogenase (short-subunit alcohol dehydrogenase family)